MIIATPSGSIKGEGGFAPSRRLFPHSPPVKGKKAKISYFWRFFYFCPSESHFAPSMPATKKKKKKKKKNLVPPLATPSGGLIVSQMFSLLLFCSCFHEKDFVH